MLDCGVHVADTGEVLKTYIACGRLFVVLGGDAPVDHSLGSPFAGLVDGPDEVDDVLEVVVVVLGKFGEKFESGVSCVVTLALGSWDVLLADSSWDFKEATLQELRDEFLILAISSRILRVLHEERSEDLEDATEDCVDVLLGPFTGLAFLNEVHELLEEFVDVEIDLPNVDVTDDVYDELEED